MRLGIDKMKVFEDLGYTPHPGQLEVHRSLAPRRILACGTRWGKTRCAAMEALAAALEPRDRSMGWVVAPTFELADKVYREIVILAAEHLPHRTVRIQEQQKRLVLLNLGGGKSEIRAKSADNPVSLLGEGLDYLIIDEAARLKPKVWESYLSQRLIDRRGWALIISTPKGKDWFFDLHRRGQDPEDRDYESWNHPSWTNPYLDRDLIEAERDRLSDRVYRQEYGGEFLEGAGAVFRYVRERATAEFRDPEPGVCYYAGLDLGRVNDYTALVIVDQRREVVHADRFRRIDWQHQIDRIHATCDRYHQARIWCDVTGAGDPIYEALLRKGCLVNPYMFTQRSKADLVENLAMMIERKQITLPRPDLWPEGIDELESFEYSVTDAGNVRTSAPWGKHDDLVVSLALAAWGVGPEDRSLEIFFV